MLPAPRILLSLAFLPLPLTPTSQPDAPRLRERLHALLPSSPGAPRAEVVAGARAYLDAEFAAIKDIHRAPGCGLAAAKARSAILDVLISALFERGRAAFPGVSVTLCALGGYGRCEQCPASDIDLLFLYPDRGVDTATLQKLKTALVDAVLYPLWDLRYKVGHSSRTIRETLEEAKHSVESKNAQLEARHLAGSDSLFQQFHTAYHNFARKEDPQGYLRDRLAAQVARRAKFANIVENQEPDIKNGVGGLRDQQNILWMAAIKLGVRDSDELLRIGYLSEREHRELTEAHDFLLRVRTALHLLTGRAGDLLTLDLQPEIASSLGYHHAEILPRVEMLMRDYFRHASAIHRHSRRIEQRLALGDGDPARTFSLAQILAARRFETKQAIDGLVLRGNTLTCSNREIFRHDPLRLLRVFRHAQQRRATLDFKLTGLIEESLDLLTPEIAFSAEASRIFLAIISSPGEVYPVLEQMRDLGVLGRFLPEFAQLHCLVQHEYYHRYTADVHTLLCLRQLDRLHNGEDPLGPQYLQALEESGLSTFLYAVLLLHDIGKPLGIKGHSDTGAEIAARVLARLGFPPELITHATGVIRLHLSMARVWQRFDLGDPATSEAFADRVCTRQVLSLLYVHTYCDASATAPDLWNSSKDQLHTTLYRRTLDILRARSGHSSGTPTPFPAISASDLQKLLPDADHADLVRHLGLLPADYFVARTPDEAAFHYTLVREFITHRDTAESRGEMADPVIRWHNDLALSQTAAHIVWKDAPGLFSLECAAFSLARLNIHGGRVLSRADGISINTIHVTDLNGGLVREKRTQEAFLQQMRDILAGRKDTAAAILALAAKQSSLRVIKPRAAHSIVNFRAKIYSDLQLRKTVVEVRARDRLGLLYFITDTIRAHGFDLIFARISTERDVASDTFYLRPAGTGEQNPDSYALLWRALDALVQEKASGPG